MKRIHKIFTMSLVFLTLTVILTSCTGGGGGGTFPAPGLPFIGAELDSFPTGSVPPGFLPSGFNSMASVSVVDDNSGSPITNAVETINGVPLTYNTTNQDYEGNLMVAFGGSVTLTVTVNGNNYTASGTQFTSYPAITTPVSGDTWLTGCANTAIWSGGTPTINASSYGLEVLDAANPNGPAVWPALAIQTVPIGTVSYTILASNLTAGDRFVIVGIGSDLVIPNAAPGSDLLIAGFNYVPITVTAPATLASGQANPYGIAIDSTSVYWTDNYGGTVNKVGINGGTISSLASGLNLPNLIAVDSTSIYWTDGGSGTVKKIGINGGTVTTLASGLSSPYGIAVDSTSVYWTESGAVKKVGINGGTITTLVSGLNTPFTHDMVIDSTSVYWTDTYGGTVNKVGTNGGAVTTLVSGLRGPAGIAVDSTSVYWTDNYAGTVSKVGINGGAVTTLVSGLSGPAGIAVDSTNVYWTEWVGGTVKKVGLNGGTITTLAAGLVSPYYIAEDSINVYWAEMSGGAVMKIAK